MHTPFLRRAIQLALENTKRADGGPFGAVVARGDQSVAEGWNQVTGTNDPTAHAEIVAIREACRRLGSFSLAGCDLYASCEPCPMCLAAIYWARIDRVFYAAPRDAAAAVGFDDAKLYTEIALPPGDRSLPIVQALRDEGLAPFAAWGNKVDRTMY